MPNVVVYVKARDAEKFEDQKALAKFVRDAAATALSERGATPGWTGDEVPNPGEDARASACQVPTPSQAGSPRSESDEVRTDFKGEKKGRR